jgi:hypothetical protein
MRLQLVFRSGHVVSEEKFAVDQAIETVSVGDRLRGRCVIGVIESELNLGTVKVAKPTFGNAAAMCKYYFKSVVRLNAPEACFKRGRSKNLAILINDPRGMVLCRGRKLPLGQIENVRSPGIRRDRDRAKYQEARPAEQGQRADQ